MNIALIVDKKGSAIHRLSVSIQRHNPHLHIDILDFHPKRPDPEQIDRAVSVIQAADIVHVGYWKSGEAVRQYVDFSKKKTVLCHYNPYDVTNDSVNAMYNTVVVGNKTMHAAIPYARHIPYGIDLDFFSYTDDYKADGPVCMVVARIEGKKGVKEVAQACKELDIPFTLVGRISDMDYFKSVVAANPDMVFRENITDEELRQVYYDSFLHVCNSQDNFESGTLPILEAMACGVPVLTRYVGHVPDLYDFTNVEVRTKSFEDIEDIKEKISQLRQNPALLQRMREKSWQTVKNWSDKRMAWQFERVYYNTLLGDLDAPWVSVIVPVYSHPEDISECVSRIAIQDYNMLEIVIVDSSRKSVDIELTKKAVALTFKKLNCPGILPPIKYIRIPYKKGVYTLAEARNTGVLHASGDLLVFCDERIGMEQHAVTEFVNHWESNSWLWGQKDGASKGFVENFSCVARKDLVFSGMFNQTACAQYGCMTQEIRTRLETRPFSPFLFAEVRSAQAVGLRKTSNKSCRRTDIIESKLRIWKLYANTSIE